VAVAVVLEQLLVETAVQVEAELLAELVEADHKVTTVDLVIMLTHSITEEVAEELEEQELRQPQVSAALAVLALLHTRLGV
jgi:hypothetical protein